MALTTHLVAVPVLAGLIVGTGAAATFVSTSAAPIPAEAATVATQPASRPCETQTWPYIDRACLGLASGQAAPQNRPVRVVAAPRTPDMPETASVIPASVPASAPAVTQTPGDVPLVSSDTVLRQPQNLKTESLAPAPKVRKPKNSRRDTQRRQRQWSAQSYQVPMELRDHATRPVIVVRPLRWGD